MADVWQIITAVGPIAAPLIAVLLYIIRKKISSFIRTQGDHGSRLTRIGRTIYGDENDPHQTGLAEDVRRLQNRVQELEQRVRELEDDD